MFRVTPAIGARVNELYTTPFGPIGRFRFWRLLPAGTAMPVIRCSELVKTESAFPSLAVFGPAPGAVNRTSYRSGVPSVGGTLPKRQTPLTSVRTDCTCAPFRYRPTVQP